MELIYLISGSASLSYSVGLSLLERWCLLLMALACPPEGTEFEWVGDRDWAANCLRVSFLPLWPFPMYVVSICFSYYLVARVFTHNRNTTGFEKIASPLFASPYSSIIFYSLCIEYGVVLKKYNYSSRTLYLLCRYSPMIDREGVYECLWQCVFYHSIICVHP